MTVQPYTRPSRSDDLAYADSILALSILDDLDLASDDIATRQVIVDRLRTWLRNFRQAGIEGHYSYSLPMHHRMLKILHAEIAELHIRLEARAA